METNHHRFGLGSQDHIRLRGSAEGGDVPRVAQQGDLRLRHRRERVGGWENERNINVFKKGFLLFLISL